MNTSSLAHPPSRIQKQIVLEVPPAKVWRALANAEDFGQWFGVTLKGKSFAAGKSVRGQITSPGYEHLVWNVQVNEMQPERLFSFRWHPAAIDPNVDYSQEPETLVEFRLENTESGTRLTLSESGFDKIPASRRADAYSGNNSGWDQQLLNIQKYLATH